MKGTTASLGWVILRLILVIHSLAVLSESVFAGQFLSGEDSQVKFHELTGWIVLAICAIQIVFAALLLRTGITSLWLVFSSFFLFLAEGLQIGTGYGRFLNVHVPLGVIIFAVVSGQTILAFVKRTSADGLRNEV